MVCSTAQPLKEETPLDSPHKRKKQQKNERKDKTVTDSDENTCLTREMLEEDHEGATVGANPATDCVEKSSCMEVNDEPDVAKTKILTRSHKRKRKVAPSILSGTDSADPESKETPCLPVASSCEMEQNTVEQTVAETPVPAPSHPEKKRKKKKKKRPKVTKYSERSIEDEKDVGQTVSSDSVNRDMSKEGHDEATVGDNPATDCGTTSLKESTCLEENNGPQRVEGKMRRSVQKRLRKAAALKAAGADCSPANVLSSTESAVPESAKIQPLPAAPSSDMEQTVAEGANQKKKRKRKKPKVAKDSVSLDEENTSIEGKMNEGKNPLDTGLPQEEKLNVSKKHDDDSVLDGVTSCPMVSSVMGTYEEGTVGSDQNMVEAIAPQKNRNHTQKRKKNATVDVDTSCDPCDNLSGSKSPPCVAEAKDKAPLQDICAEEVSQVNSLDVGACFVAVGPSASSEEKKGIEDSSCTDNHNIKAEMKNNQASSSGGEINSDPSHVTPKDSHGVQELSLPLTKTVGVPRRKLLVLDLNGLLADFIFPQPIGITPDFRIKQKAVFKRPYSEEFLDFCFERFDVGLWSSRTRWNLDRAVDLMMGDRRKKLLFCWCEEQCSRTGTTTMENRMKPLVMKELRKLWEDVEEHGLPWKKGDYDASNTLLLDDTPYKALCNPPYTAIFPVPFSYMNRSHDQLLGPDGELRKYLEELVLADNVQDFVREHPIGQMPITESHGKWHFYAKAIDYVLRAADHEHESKKRKR